MLSPPRLLSLQNTALLPEILPVDREHRKSVSAFLTLRDLADAISSQHHVHRVYRKIHVNLAVLFDIPSWGKVRESRRDGGCKIRMGLLRRG